MGVPLFRVPNEAESQANAAANQPHVETTLRKEMWNFGKSIWGVFAGTALLPLSLTARTYTRLSNAAWNTWGSLSLANYRINKHIEEFGANIMKAADLDRVVEGVKNLGGRQADGHGHGPAPAPAAAH